MSEENECCDLCRGECPACGRNLNPSTPNTIKIIDIVRRLKEARDAALCCVHDNGAWCILENAVADAVNALDALTPNREEETK